MFEVTHIGDSLSVSLYCKSKEQREQRYWFLDQTKATKLKKKKKEKPLKLLLNHAAL